MSEINPQALKLSLAAGLGAGVGSLGLYYLMANRKPKEEEPTVLTDAEQ